MVRGALQSAAAEAAWRVVTPSIAGTPHVRISRDGGRTYPARHARPLPADPPGQPCTVPVYEPATGTGRMLALDLDPARVDCDVHDAAVHHDREHHADLGVGVGVGAQAEAITALAARLGGQVLADVAPSGGCHVFVLFAAPLPWRELRDLARAMAVRFPAIDTAPMSSLGGQISPPGARHKSGGWRVLTTPSAAARAAVERPNGPEVWNALLQEFAGELNHVLHQHGDNGLIAELDDSGVPWAPRPGGRAPLSPELDHVARTGKWDRSHHVGRSEARMAILASAAARGWQLADVRTAIASDAWKGLPALYERPSEPGRLDRLLPLEWRKAIVFVSGEENVRPWPTSDVKPRPPVGEPASPAEYGLIRRWVTATDCAAGDPERVKGWGGYGIAVRLVLAALGQAAMVSGSSVVEFGTRNLSLHCALSHRTVGRVLELLRDEPDPLIDLVSRRQMARADRYQLRIPDAYADSVRWRRRRAGRIDAIHPAFLVLGSTAGLVYQALGEVPARGAEVARTARLSATATSAALRVLAGHGLAEPGPGGWRRGGADLNDVAEVTGAAELQRERAERYRQDRESWRARLRQYQGARQAPVIPSDGWLALDDEDEWDAMLASRWPVLGEDFVRGPPPAAANGITGVA